MLMCNILCPELSHCLPTPPPYNVALLPRPHAADGVMILNGVGEGGFTGNVALSCDLGQYLLLRVRFLASFTPILQLIAAKWIKADEKCKAHDGKDKAVHNYLSP